MFIKLFRSNLEFSLTVWHSSLSGADRQDLERAQKAAVKVMALKFAKKSL